MARSQTAMERFQAAARNFMDQSESFREASARRLAETEKEIQEKSARLVAINSEIIDAMASNDAPKMKALREEEGGLAGALSDLRQRVTAIRDSGITQTSGQKYSEIEALAKEAWVEHETGRRKAAAKYDELTAKIDLLLDEQEALAQEIIGQSPIPGLLYGARTHTDAHETQRKSTFDIRDELIEATGLHTRIEVRQPKNMRNHRCMPIVAGGPLFR